MSLLIHFAGFPCPFTSSLPFFILVGLLAINLAISASWSYFLIPFLFSLSYIFYIVGLLLLLGHLSKVGICYMSMISLWHVKATLRWISWRLNWATGFNFQTKDLAKSKKILGIEIVSDIVHNSSITWTIHSESTILGFIHMSSWQISVCLK